MTIAPITSTIRDISTEVIIDQRHGMKTTCAINFDHIQTVSKGKVSALISMLPESKREEIKSALLFALGFDR